MPSLTIVLLCHDRPKLAVKAIKSILNQTDKAFRFIVSDNSSTNALQEILAVEFPSIEYISRFPGIPAFDHFKAVISLVDTPYFVMFHDDDVMEPDFVRAILEQFQSTPGAAAIGTNAHLIDDNDKEIGGGFAFRSPRRIETFSDKRMLLLQYLVGDLGGVSPWCSYAYNAKLIRGLFPDFSLARNYCDTMFLAEVVERGPIVWINEPLIRTRVHGDSLSHSSGVRDYKSFITLIERDRSQAIERRYLDEYRFPRLFVALRKRRRLPYPALRFFVRVLPKLMIRSRSFRRRIFGKLLRLGGLAPPVL